jgi:hypothetical protein
MGLYNFQPRFVKPILSGAKTHTIRAIRVHPDKPGNTLHLYTGLRTKQAKLLMRVPCVKIEEIAIRIVTVNDRIGYQEYRIEIDGAELDADECGALARRDGFPDFKAMMKFWREPKNRLPFKGHIIFWLYDGNEKQR